MVGYEGVSFSYKYEISGDDISTSYGQTYRQYPQADCQGNYLNNDENCPLGCRSFGANQEDSQANRCVEYPTFDGLYYRLEFMDNLPSTEGEYTIAHYRTVNDCNQAQQPIDFNSYALSVCHPDPYADPPVSFTFECSPTQTQFSTGVYSTGNCSGEVIQVTTLTSSDMALGESCELSSDENTIYPNQVHYCAGPVTT